MQDYHHKLLITLLFISQINSNKTIEISLVYRTNRIPFLLHFINTCRDQKMEYHDEKLFWKKTQKNWYPRTAKDSRKDYDIL